MRRTSTNSPGFTLVELIIVLTIMGILLVLVLTTLANFYYDNTRSLGSTFQTGDTQGSLRTIEKDVRTAERFLIANSVTDPASVSQWDYKGTDATHRVLILNAYATTVPASADTAGTRSLVYTGGLCDQAIKNNLVYFVSSGTLYRRTIKNTTTPCGGLTIGQKQSCPANTSAAYCQANDAVILTNVDSFDVSYYSTSAASSPTGLQYQWPHTAPEQTEIENTTLKTIQITVQTKQKLNGSDNIVTNKLRMTRKN